MAYKSQPSFSTGELDPALHERTDLQKYASGLATARNVIIGKTGRILSRPGRRQFLSTGETGAVRIHPVPLLGMFMVISASGIEIYDFDGQIRGSDTSAIPESVIETMKIVNVKDEAVVMFTGAAIFVYDLREPNINRNNLDFISRANFNTSFNIHLDSYSRAYVSSTLTGTGYNVDYAFSTVVNGEESAITELTYDAGTFISKLPITSTTKNTIVVDVSATGIIVSGKTLEQVRFYRRPAAGGAYGYVGSTTFFSGDNASFVDYGQAADFNNTPPSVNTGLAQEQITSPEDLTSPAAGIYYQERLLITYRDQIIASKTGFWRNFYRDYPLQDDSSLTLKVGSGYSRVLHLAEFEGLVAFTTAGVFYHTGALSTTNLALIKKGNWVIDEAMPPVNVPGGLLFVDSLSNTVRQLVWSEDTVSFQAPEISIFSDHLFTGQKITSWAFEDGEFPLLWIRFNNGKSASFTYEREQEMRAWTRHDHANKLSWVSSTGPGYNPVSDEVVRNGEIIFVHEDSIGEKHIEVGVTRYPTAEEFVNDTESDKSKSWAAMDSMMSWSHLINDDLTDDDLTLSVITTWDADLTLSCTDDAIFTDPGIGAVGTIFKYFDEDRSEYELEVTARANDNSVTVTPNILFPSTAATNPRLYECKSVFDDTLDVQYRELLSFASVTVMVAPVSPGVWNGPLTITFSVPIIPGNVNLYPDGKVYYYVDSSGNEITLTQTANNGVSELTVTPSSTFPSGDASSPAIYHFKYIAYSLDHLEGESVSIMADGAVLSSPNNDIENYTVSTVSSGSLTLPGGVCAAIVHIGRPFTSDVETLDIDTIEQRPVLIESETMNKVYIKLNKSRGFYISGRFPSGTDQLLGTDATTMQAIELSDISRYDVDYENEEDIIANRYDQPVNKRIEATLPGDWKSNGRIAIRNVDPTHFEILSIIPDLEALKRSDRGSE